MDRESYLIFLDLENDFVINVVPLKSAQFIPRVGDTLGLPGKEEDLLPLYEVVAVRYSYIDDHQPDNPNQARLESITIEVREVQGSDEEEARLSRDGSAVN